MLNVYFDITKNDRLLDKFSERGRRRILKEAFRFSLEKWRVEALPKHFRQGNIEMYPGQFTAKKKGVPLVDTGAFSRRILKQKEIRSTYKGANIGFQFGRPSNTNTGKLSAFNQRYRANIKEMDSKTKAHIFSYMKGKKISFQEAVNKLVANKYAETSYSAKTRVKMKKGVSAFNDRDRQEIRDNIKNFIIENMNTLGKANL